MSTELYWISEDEFGIGLSGGRVHDLELDGVQTVYWANFFQTNRKLLLF